MAGEFVEKVGMPADDGGSRGAPSLSGISNTITGYRHDEDAVDAAPIRVVVAVGIESHGTSTGQAKVLDGPS